MNKIETLNLIEGKFSQEEAKDILMDVLTAKINFHQLKNFSSQERFGKQDETARKRIPELKKEVEKVLQVISEAKLKDGTLIINSKIDIYLSTDQ